MNNRTISIFEDDDYNNNLYTFNLEKKTNFLKNKKFCCFNLKDSYKQYIFCGFDSSCGSKTKNVFVDSWLDDFNLFKYQCKVGIKLLKAQDLKIIGEKFKDKMGSVEADLAAKRESLIHKRVNERDLILLRKKALSTENMGYKVLAKEIDLDSLITKEEKEREELEFKNLLEKIKKEKMKKHCLRKKIKEKQL